MSSPHRLSVKPAVRALTLSLALLVVAAGCRSPESKDDADMTAEFREARTEMIKAMRAAGATPEQIRQAEAQLDAVQRQMRSLEKQAERMEKSAD